MGDATKAAIFSIVERHGSRWKDTLSPTPDAVINDLRVVEPELFGRLEPRVLPADKIAFPSREGAVTPECELVVVSCDVEVFITILVAWSFLAVVRYMLNHHPLSTPSVSPRHDCRQC